MLKLSTPSRDPFWLDILPGVRIQFRPISVADMLVARAAAESLGTKVEGDLALDRSTTVAAGAAFTRSLALSGIVAWEGIGDAGGKPIDPIHALAVRLIGSSSFVISSSILPRKFYK
jgi:hypothetical protein